MRNLSRALVAGSLLLAIGGAAHADDILINSLGTGTAFNLNTANGNGRFVGYEPTLGAINPQTNAGYSVLPFTVGSGVSEQLTSVSIPVNVASPTSAPSGNLYGVLIANPTGNSINANISNQVGSFFQFDLIGAGAEDATGVGQNSVKIVTATLASGPVVTAGNYWIVFAPKAGYNAQAGDSLLDYSTILNRTSGQIATAANGGSLSTAFATETLTQFENATTGPVAGANPGDVLAPTISGVTNQYFGARVTGVSTAAVPEASTVFSMLIGLSSVGGIVVRRRRSTK